MGAAERDPVAADPGLLNPLVYISEGLRGALTPTMPHMPTWAYSLALLGGVIAIGALALRTFTRRIVT